MFSNIVVQLIGFVGLVFLVLAFQQKKRGGILGVMLTGQLIFLIHFALLGAWTGVAMNIVGSFRTLVFRYRGVKNWASGAYWPWIFIALFWAGSLVSWQGMISLLPPTAMTIETIGLWMKNPSRIRLINLFPHPFWLAYNMINQSWAGIATEVFVIISVMVAILRYDLIPGIRRRRSG